MGLIKDRNSMDLTDAEDTKKRWQEYWSGLPFPSPVDHILSDLSQILYDYTEEVRNRFKGLDLTDRVPDELWMEVHDNVQETGIKTIPMEKKCKNEKWLSEEAL